VPEEDRALLQRQLAPYRRAHPGVRWTRPETWHLTLLFIGSLARERVAELEALVEAVGREVVAYEITIERGGGRPGQRGGVAWLGATRGARSLLETASLLAARCPPDIAGGSPPKRTPSAHLTVVRAADRAVIEALRSGSLGPHRASWTVDRVDLVRSHLGPGGARYETLHSATL